MKPNETHRDETRKRVFEFLGPTEDKPHKGAPTLTRYEMGTMLGEGAMAFVFEARDKNLNRTVAIKVMKETLTEDTKARERFQREAQAMAGLSHPNIVTLHDAGIEGGQLYMVMELVEGRPFRDLLGISGANRIPELTYILEKVARGVDTANAQGIVHRDLKPENILVTPGGEPKVSDFGVAHLLETNAGLTKIGAVMGTPLYMAPEQVRGDLRAITRRTDVYALGVMLYEILTGRPPFEARSSTEIFQKTLDEIPIRPANLFSSIPKDLETICMKALEKDPMMRYGTAAEFADEIQRYSEGHPILARPTSWMYRLNRYVARRRAVFFASAFACLMALAFGALSLTEMLQDQARFEEAMGMALRMENKNLNSEARDEYFRALQLKPDSAEAADGLNRMDAILEAHRRTLMGQINDSDKIRQADTILENVRAQLLKAENLLYSPAATHARISERVNPALEEIAKARVLAPEHAPVLLQEGRAWNLLGHQKKSESALRAALELNPNLADAHLRLGRLLMIQSYLIGQGMLDIDAAEQKQEAIDLALLAAEEIDRSMAGGVVDEVQKRLARAMLAYSTHEWAHLKKLCLDGLKKYSGERGTEDFHWLLAQTLEGKERFHRLTRAIEIRPTHYLAVFGKASMFWAEDKREQARTLMDRIMEIVPNDGLMRLNRGTMHLQLNNAGAAVLDFTRALELLGEHGLTYGARSTGYAVTGELDKALDDIKRAIELRPKDPRLFVNRSIIYRMRKEFNKALADCNKALGMSPDYAEAVVRRAEVKRDMGRPNDAIKDFTLALNKEPKNYLAHKYLANLYLEFHKHKQAFQFYNRVIKLYPLRHEMWHLRGKAHIHVRLYEKAIVDLTRAIQLNGKFMDYYMSRAKTYGRLKQWEKAFADILKAFELDPAHPRIHFARAELYRNKGEHAKAVQDYTETIRKDPTHWNAYIGRGRSHLATGNRVEAVSDATEAVTRKPEHPEPYYQRGKIFWALKRLKAARGDFERALKFNDPTWDSHKVREMKELLKTLK